MKIKDEKFKFNNEIIDDPLLVLDEEGKSLGIMSNSEAKAKVKELQKDLILINANSVPVAVKIGDKSKYLFQKKKEIKKQPVSKLKEISLKVCTGIADIKIKIQNARRLFAEGHKINFNMLFRKKESGLAEEGKKKMQIIIDELSDIAALEESINEKTNARGNLTLSMVMKKTVNKK